MIHLINPEQASATYQEKAIGNLVVPVSLDNIPGSELFIKATSLYPELPEVFEKTSAGKNYKPGYTITLDMNNGDKLHLIVIKKIDKYQADLFDIITGLTNTLNNLAKNNITKIMVPVINSKVTKLHDTIMIPAIIQALNVPDIDVYAVVGEECTSLIDTTTDGVISWKQDCWKSDWMLQFDDILFVDIIHEVNRLTHGFKLSKGKLMKCYRTCFDNGMFPKIEFYTTEYGEYFKMFMPKYSSLLNHGLLMNTFHFAKVVQGTPSKSDLRIGPMFPHLKHVAYKSLLAKSELVKKIAIQIKDDYQKQRQESYQRYKDNKENGGYQKTNYKSNKPDTENFFGL